MSTPKYKIYVEEGGVLIPVRGPLEFDQLDEAIKAAERRVDDALPSNTVHVMVDVGYASLSGDGDGACWERNPDSWGTIPEIP